jgi:UDP-3-O-acyl N-acetylglucosamine deacetylase
MTHGDYVIRSPIGTPPSQLVLESQTLDTATRQQTTIASTATVRGFGFWSGHDVKLEFHPAAANAGVTFVRTDLPGRPEIDALVRHRIQGPRRTTLVDDDCAVEMVEHVLAALAGMQIDNCEVHVDRAEMPGCDGSSLAFTTALKSAGRVIQAAPRKKIEVTRPIRVGDDHSWIEARPNSDGKCRVTFELDYPDEPAIGAQTCTYELSQETFEQEIASARTFVLVAEAEALQSKGLGCRVTDQDVLVFDHVGPTNNSLRFANECARHKALDMIGDFSLAGADLAGDFVASRSGHRLNSQMVYALLSQAAEQTSERRSA